MLLDNYSGSTGSVIVDTTPIDMCVDESTSSTNFLVQLLQDYVSRNLYRLRDIFEYSDDNTTLYCSALTGTVQMMLNEFVKTYSTLCSFKISVNILRALDIMTSNIYLLKDEGIDITQMPVEIYKSNIPDSTTIDDSYISEILDMDIKTVITSEVKRINLIDYVKNALHVSCSQNIDTIYSDTKNIFVKIYDMQYPSYSSDTNMADFNKTIITEIVHLYAKTINILNLALCTAITICTAEKIADMVNKTFN